LLNSTRALFVEYLQNTDKDSASFTKEKLFARTV